jgi:peptide deformylase
MAAPMKIILHPDPRLRLKSEPVTVFDAELEETVKSMALTMNKAKGIGLAAVQVAIMKRLLIIDIGELDDDDDYLEGSGPDERRLSEKKRTSNLEVFINPEILDPRRSRDRQTQRAPEASLPRPEGQDPRNRDPRPAKHRAAARNRSPQRRHVPRSPRTDAEDHGLQQI